MKHTLLIYVLLAIGIQVSAQQKAEVTVRVDKGEYQINKHIYGHFPEHLGRGIYGGLWVGEKFPPFPTSTEFVKTLLMH